MTENEAIKNINALNAVCLQKDFYDEEFARTLTTAIQALSEIQKYRAIGTVEKIKEELERLRNDNECQGLYFTLEERKALAKQSRELSEYKGIGTIEELKALKNIGELAYSRGYNKAIDDFVKFASTMPTVETEDGEIRPMWLEEMAKKLKESEAE